MIKQDRDLTLDYIRSFACLLMMCVHTYITEYTATEYFRFFASYTPAIFFSISGYLSAQQVKRNKTSHIVLLYLLFFILGFSFNGFMPISYFPRTKTADAGTGTLQPDGLNFFYHVDCEIIQAISLGCILVAVTAKLFKDRYILYLFTCFGILGLYKLLASFVPDFTYRNFFIAPGAFPPVPWAAYAFFGVFAYGTRNRNNGILFLASVLVCALVYFALQYRPEWHAISDGYMKYKFSMSNWYMLISFAVLFIVYYIFRQAGNRLPKGKNNMLIFFGQNSMLFLFIHYIISYYLMIFQIRFFVFTWSALFILTYLFMRLLIHLNSKIRVPMHNLALWALLAILIFATPVLFRSNLILIIHLELLYGIVFSLRYGDLSYRIKYLSGRVHDDSVMWTAPSDDSTL